MFGGFFDFASSSSSMSMSLPSTFGASSSSTAERDHMMPELPSGALKWESDWNSSSLMLNDEPCSELLNFPDDFDLQLPPPPVPLTATATAVVSSQHDSELPGSLLLSPSSSSSSSLTSTGSGSSSSSSSSSSTLALASGNAPSSPGVMHVTSTQLWATPDAFAGFTANAHLADTLGAVGSATDQTVGLAQVQNCSKFLWTKPASRPTLSLRAGGSGGIAIESVSSLGAAAVAAAADDTNNDFSDIVTPDLIHSLGGAAPALLAAAKTDEDVDIDVGDIKDLNPFYNWNFDSSSRHGFFSMHSGVEAVTNANLAMPLCSNSWSPIAGDAAPPLQTLKTMGGGGIGIGIPSPNTPSCSSSSSSSSIDGSGGNGSNDSPDVKAVFAEMTSTVLSATGGRNAKILQAFLVGGEAAAAAAALESRLSKRKKRRLVPKDTERYAEMRRKNNISSQKCRANRKQRAQIQVDHLNNLDVENQRLKGILCELEDRLRAIRAALAHDVGAPA